MRRFFLEEIDESAEKAEITGEEFTHLKKVLRLGPGDGLAIFNGKGLELTGRIESIGQRSAVITIEGRNEKAIESALDLVLLQGLLKGDRPEFIVQKATELGLTGICFYTTARTVPRVDGEGAEKKLLRWKKASIEAAKQCGRTTLPRITLAAGLKEAVQGSTAELKLLLWEKEGAVSLGERLEGRHPHSAALLVGPEGGLSDDEALLAEKAGFLKAGMGPRILRAETAAVAASAIVQYAFGGLS
ncbi:MAG: 16S rRNA (uracil(1498)-N(3))-methyltransferase [Deltaproteobacteria bacterium]|nr:16S rRNA (uracil(1498)-N(3))-methyltransferase [Deltaproteobacteria bacterium]